MPTITTIPFVLLLFIVWRMARGQVLAVVVFMSIFQAASVLNIGELGIAPWLPVLLLGTVAKAARSGSSPSIVRTGNLLAIRTLLAFVAYALFTGFIYPVLFRGVIVEGSRNPLPAPLVFSIANLAQMCYLLAAGAVFILAVLSSREEIAHALTWYVRGCVVASIFAFYQLAHATTGLLYPSAVLYSNPRYVIFPAYTINGMWRLSSTFTEASALAGSLVAGIAITAWEVTTQPLRWRTCLSLAVMCLALVFTLSTTGYLCLAFILLMVTLHSIRTLLRERSLSRSKAITAVGAGIALAIILATTNAAGLVEKGFRTVILEKSEGSSYRDRVATNTAALETARQTYYIGAGWGSVRCSSLIAGLLATVGIPGTAVFAFFFLTLMTPLFRRGYRIRPSDLYEKSLLATLTLMVGMSVAGNEPDAPVLWLLFAACSAGPERLAALAGAVRGSPRTSIWHRQPELVSVHHAVVGGANGRS